MSWKKTLLPASELKELNLIRFEQMKTTKGQKQWEDLINKIEKVKDKGEPSMEVSTALVNLKYVPDYKERLENAGYELKFYTSLTNVKCVTISWKNA